MSKFASITSRRWTVRGKPMLKTTQSETAIFGAEAALAVIGAALRVQ
jgi:hypothetical protein